MMNALFVLLVSLAVNLKGDNVIQGDTYTMRWLAGWEVGTTEKMVGHPFRGMRNGYKLTKTSRCNSDGMSLEITEYMNCSDYKLIQKMDSLSHSVSELIHKTEWKYSVDKCWYASVDISCKPFTHPETKKRIVPRMKEWYIAGKNNVYVVSLAGEDATMWEEILLKAEALLLTLKEK